jgi:hypothetical protein
MRANTPSIIKKVIFRWRGFNVHQYAYYSKSISLAHLIDIDCNTVHQWKIINFWWNDIKTVEFSYVHKSEQIDTDRPSVDSVTFISDKPKIRP